MAQSYADKVREQMAKKAEQAATSRGSSAEYVPDFGSVKVRLLPPIGYPNDIQFYYTHSFHFIEGAGAEGKGKFLWSKKTYEDENGNKIKDPIDVAVDNFYKANDETYTKLAGKIKRKRHFFMRAILVDEPDPEKKFIILKDNSADGKLIRKLASIMGIPFMRDVEDEWWDKASLDIDGDKKTYDLLDPEEGFDLKITKKKTGKNPWDVSYDESFAVGKARALTDEERQIMEDNQVDLKTIVNYEQSLTVVQSALDEFIDRFSPGGASVSKAPKASPKPRMKAEEAEADDDTDDVSEAELLDALN